MRSSVPRCGTCGAGRCCSRTSPSRGSGRGPARGSRARSGVGRSSCRRVVSSTIAIAIAIVTAVTIVTAVAIVTTVAIIPTVPAIASIISGSGVPARIITAGCAGGEWEWGFGRVWSAGSTWEAEGTVAFSCRCHGCLSGGCILSLDFWVVDVSKRICKYEKRDIYVGGRYKLCLLGSRKN